MTVVEINMYKLQSIVQNVEVVLVYVRGFANKNICE